MIDIFTGIVSARRGSRFIFNVRRGMTNVVGVKRFEKYTYFFYIINVP